jgi:PAS domain S-box-containing protein
MAAIETLVAETDWSSVAIGPPESWPLRLQVAFNILRSSRFPMILFWGRDLIQLYNDAYVPILGPRHPSAFGQRACDCWPDIWDSVGPMLTGVLETGQATWSENLLLPLVRDGVPGEHYFTFSYSPITDGKRIGGVFCAVTETTASILREREARERVEALAELDRTKSDFFNNISHEFRTPLTLMLGPLETLANGADAGQRPLVEIAQRNALRLLKLVNALLQFSRLEAGHREASFVETDLAAMTTDLAAGFRSAIERAGLHLIVSSDLTEPVFVDRAMWEKIVLNLLSNALKFTLEGTIRVDVTVVDGNARLSVSDTGVGVPADELPSMFERFRRLRSMPSRSYEGSGIGLALTRELVRLHGGSIEAESEVGRGTTIRVTIPLGSAHLDPAQIVTDVEALHVSSVDQYLADVDATIGGPGPAPPAPEPRGTTERARILLADDNGDLRDYVSRVLAPQHDVVAVKNGAEALRAARSSPFDLIISDAMMPELDGVALLEAIRSDDTLAAVPFIFLSAKAGEESAVDALRRGANDYLVKPFTADQLIARVNAQVATARRQEAFLSRALAAGAWFERQGDSRTNDIAFRDFANQLPIPIWQQDIFGSLTFTNAAWHELLHMPYDPSSHTGDAWRTIIHPDDFDAALAAITAAVESRSAYEINYRLKPRDGGDDAYRWYVARAVPQIDANGVFKGWIGAIMDVHEAQLREDAERRMRLEASKALADFQSLADNVSQIVYTQHPDGTIEWVNRRWHEFTRLPPEKANTREGLQQVMPPDDYAVLMAARAGSVVSSEPYEVEVRIKPVGQPDSAYRWHLIRAVPVRGADGRIIRWAGTGTDVHDRRVAAAERERDLQALSEALPAIVWTATPDGAGEYFNARLTDYAGITSAEAAGEGWLSLIHPDDLARTAAAWDAARETGTTYEVSYRLRGRDGEYRWFSIRGVPLRDADGAIVRWIGTCIDVDEEKRSYDRDRRASEAFQEAALPQALPTEPGVTFSAVYQAGSSEALVGGDWYDAFRLLDGRIVFSVGDVMGSGLDAAVMMSAVRQSIRGAAQIYPDPCAVLDAADRALRSGNPEAIVTAFVGVFDPVGHSISYASAGHPPPFLREESGAIVKLGEPGLPLGLRIDKHEQTSQTMRLPARPSMLVLYTDGFTEATRDVEEGERHLCRLMASESVLSAAHPAREIIAAVTDRIHDDVAILVLRFDAVRYPSARGGAGRPTGSYWRFDACDDAMARSVRAAIVAELRQHDVDDADAATAELLFSELLGNVVRHSGGEVEIALDLTQVPVLHVLDRGPGFTFTTRLPANLLNETGRGLFIVSSLAREFSVVPRQDGGSHARVVLPFDVATRARPITGARQLITSS